jgi:hypothetical protein
MRDSGREHRDWVDTGRHERKSVAVTSIARRMGKYDPVGLATEVRVGAPRNGGLRGVRYGIRGTDIPLRLTKKASYCFLHAPDHYTVEEALRWGQIFGFGGKLALVDAVITTWLGRSFEHETYWENVIRFFIHDSDSVIDRLGPLVEYLRFQKGLFRLEPPIPQKQKAVVRLLEQVAKWRPPTSATGNAPILKWRTIGIRGLQYDEDQRGDRRTWTIRELLDSSELAAEGRAMRHCVGGYSRCCQAQQSSVWSMTCYSYLGQKHILTIEVNPNTRTIVQVKGRRNSRPSSESRAIMRAGVGTIELHDEQGALLRAVTIETETGAAA